MPKVIIEWMEMPKCCDECRFYDYSICVCCALPIYDYRGFRVDSQRIKNSEIRDELCPLQEVKE